MSECLTLEILQRAMDNIRNMPEPPQEVIHCHPLEHPFYSSIFESDGDVGEVMSLMDECFRKYRVGNKRGIEKWQMQPLIEQYTRKLAAL